MNIIEKLKTKLDNLKPDQITQIDRILDQVVFPRDFVDQDDMIANVYKFVYPWQPIHTLIYNEMKNRPFIAWCEFPADSEAREVALRAQPTYKDPYIVIPVTLVLDYGNRNSEVTQTVVAWAPFTSDIKSLGCPYQNSEHQHLWRAITQKYPNTDIHKIRINR